MTDSKVLDRLRPLELLDLASRQLLVAGWTEGRMVYVKTNMKSEKSSLQEADLKLAAEIMDGSIPYAIEFTKGNEKILLTVPSSDREESGAKNAGTVNLSSIKKLTDLIQAESKGTAEILIPFAEASKREHWYLFKISGGNNTLYDPKDYSGCGCCSTTKNLKKILQTAGYPNVEVELVGLQSTTNDTLCGYCVATMIGDWAQEHSISARSKDKVPKQPDDTYRANFIKERLKQLPINENAMKVREDSDEGALLVDAEDSSNSYKSFS